MINQQRQIPVALNPTFVGVPNNRLAGGPDDERLFELGLGVHDNLAINGFQPVMRNNRALLGEAGRVFFLTGQIGKRDKQREIGVHVASRFKSVIQFALHLFPNGKAVRLDDHAAPHGGVFG